MSGTLYLVPTPIGNLGDISPRMAQTMAQADFIAAEDTRVTMKLLNHLELKKPMVSYYRHNSENSGQSILQPGRGSGGPVRPERRAGGVYSRSLRPGHRPGGLRPAHGTLHL